MAIQRVRRDDGSEVIPGDSGMFGGGDSSAYGGDGGLIDRTGSGLGEVQTGEGGSSAEGNAERPRDRAPEIPTEIIPPTGVPQPGTPSEGTLPSTPAYEDPSKLPPPPTTAEVPPQSTTAPPMPTEPTPIASEPSQPFTPMPPPPSVVRKQITGAPQLPSSNLLGRAGGLLGGGLGVPATARGETGSVSALIEQLLRRGF